MFFTPKSLSLLVALAPVAFAVPGPAWLRRQSDAQSSLTLDPAVIDPGLAQDGQGGTPTPGQVSSLTSTNNFINFCLTQNTTLTNGQQVITGSCNPTPMGRIISLDSAPSSKFVFPKNTDSSLQPNQAFVVQMQVSNMALGNFVNAQSNYYAAPQQVNGQGLVIGHTHFVIEPIPSFNTTEPLDVLNFAFFKGVNGAADANGIVTASVDKGIPAGFYRLCSINTASNHQPVLVSNAQHGALDDCVYFAVGQGNDPFNLNGGNGTASASASATDSASVSSASDSASVSSSDSASPSDSASVSSSDSASVSSVSDSASVSSSDSAAATATASDSSSSAPAATQSEDAGQNGNQNGADQNNNDQNGGNNNNQQQGGNNNNNANNQQGNGNN